MPVHAAARRTRDFEKPRGDVREFTPSDISGGFHLSSAYGVSHSAGTLTGWLDRGNLSPSFVVKGTGITVDANGDIDFPAAVGSFLYEGTPIDRYNSHTIFGLYRRDLVNVAAGEVLISKYISVTPNRAFQVAHDGTTPFAPKHFASSDGAGATTSLTIGPTASGWNFFVARKNGTVLSSWWNGIANADQTTQSTVFDTVDPISIGGRAGSASADVISPIDCAVRDIGFFNSSLSAANVTLLLDYLAGRM